jgi:CHAT domain-containing protein/tetratricopeptide (TPR) repeat protein
MVIASLLLALQVAAAMPDSRSVVTIAPGATQVFEVTVGAERQFVRGQVDQETGDVSVTIVDPAGKQVTFHDAQQRGREIVAFVAAVAGRYRVEIRSIESSGPPSRYRVRFDAPRPVTAEDESLEAAVRASTDARRLFKQGQRDALLQSLDVRTTVLPRWRALDTPDMVLVTLAGIGDTHYRLGQYEAAQAAYTDALPLARARDADTEAEVINNLAMSEWRLGDVPQARTHLEQALTIWRRTGSADEAKALSNLGIIQRQSGEYDEARRAYARALAIHRRTQNARSAAFALNNLAITLDALGRRQDAVDQLTRAIAQFHAFGERRAEGRALIAMSDIQLAIGRRETALMSAQRGLALVREAGDRRAEAEGIERLGRVFLAKRDPAAARDQFSRALELYGEVHSPRGESDALHGLGLTALASGDGAQAIGFFDRALEARRAIEAVSLQAETLARRAQAARLTGDLVSARNDAEAAIQLAEQMRSGVFERELRLSYSAAVHRYYTEDIAILADLHRTSPDEGFDALAFAAADRVKARTALERLRESKAAWAAAADPALRRRERELRGLLNYWALQLWDQSDQPGSAAVVAKIRARLETISAEHDRIEGEIRRQQPRLAALALPEAITLARLREDVVTPETVLVAFSLGESRSYVWALTREDFILRELPARAVIERQARALLDAIDHQPPNEKAADLSQAHARAATVSRTLLSPIAAFLSHHRTLVVVPDGVLHTVPFDVLPSPARSEPLVESHEILAAPSLSLVRWLIADAAARQPAPKTVAALGDPVFAANDERVTSGAGATSSGAPLSTTRAATLARRFSRLPFSRDEVTRIVALAPVSRRLQAVDFDASRALVEGGALRDYRYVHFATHAIRDDRHPDLSGIVLSLVGPGGVPQDGFLRLQDIYGLRLRADLVVLSACETALGRQTAGEGLQSLVHGFFQAGASRVLASLWKVDDEATTALMARFYERLLTGERSPAAALRQAQRDVRRQPRWAHPFYWSGWVLQGSR